MDLVLREIGHDFREAGTGQCNEAEPGRVCVPDNVSPKRFIDKGVDADPFLQRALMESLGEIFVQSKASDDRLGDRRASGRDLCQVDTDEEIPV